MSEIMLSVLEMPDDLFWADDPMSRHQHNQVRKEAAKEIRENRARIAELEAAVASDGGSEIFHEKRMINGILCWRAHPDAEFVQYSAAQLSDMLVGARIDEADLDRYRFIRERISVTDLQLILGRKPDPEPAYEVEIDAVVDAAMSK